ncbi:MAG: helix-turn-helix domain-containing protein [Bacilli bacterium]|jgi:transcriptional regulator with XRE-family HTH domain|nr:helix-turn-helix domain-containing protein [Bacilli bacterium]
MKFGDNLMMIRKNKGFSQESLGDAVGVSRQTIYSWEAELNYPNIVMLKKIADVLGVTSDDLLCGYDVGQFPNQIGEVGVSFVKKHAGALFYDELPNWFVRLSVGEGVCFALYDGGKRDYCYRLNVASKIVLHEEEGMEVVVDEYDPCLSHRQTYSSFVQVKNDRVSFIGRIYEKDGLKRIETFKDKGFLKNWGFGDKNVGQGMTYEDCDDCLLTYKDKEIDVIRIFYFDPDGSKDQRHAFFETFLNQNGESLYWRRYTKGGEKGKCMEIEGVPYKLDYECLTSRFGKI